MINRNCFAESPLPPTCIKPWSVKGIYLNEVRLLCTATAFLNPTLVNRHQNENHPLPFLSVSSSSVTLDQSQFRRGSIHFLQNYDGKTVWISRKIFERTDSFPIGGSHFVELTLVQLLVEQHSRIACARARPPDTKGTVLWGGGGGGIWHQFSDSGSFRRSAKGIGIGFINRFHETACITCAQVSSIKYSAITFDRANIYNAVGFFFSAILKALYKSIAHDNA